MAVITNYATLLQAVADYLNRSDLTTFIPNFLQNAESTLYKTLRIRAMENQLTLTVTGGVASIPTVPLYVELKHAYVATSPVKPLQRVAPEQIYTMFPTRSGGAVPKYIAIEGDYFIFGPYPSNVTVQGVYYGRLAALSGTNTTNWFTSYAPDLLLYGALVEAEPFLVGDERVQTWARFYQRAYDAVQGEEMRQKSSGSKLSTRVS